RSRASRRRSPTPSRPARAPANRTENAGANHLAPAPSRRIRGVNDEQLLRYSRHILLPEVGIEGQERLRAARALVVGAGGLGCPASLYLAAAGIGRLTIADSDKVDLTNLQRQILYRTESVGAVKVEAAQAALQEFNPNVQIVALHQRVTDFSNLVEDSDIVLDCSDNFATRHALNRACVKARKPLVAGAAIRFDA